ncbi:MAG: hypothetical protein MMC23_010112 [Stictis urceolatum]|nr:hypothetical protein [Stictis urceolata]
MFLRCSNRVSSVDLLHFILFSLYASHFFVHAAIPIPKVDPVPEVPQVPDTPSMPEGGGPDNYGGISDDPPPTGGISNDPPYSGSGSSSSSGSDGAQAAQDPLEVPSSASQPKQDEIRELAEKVQDLIDAASSLAAAFSISGSGSASFTAFSPTTNTRSSPSQATLTPDPVSACAIFSTYTNECSSLARPTRIVIGSTSSLDAQASCACYSAGYFVPQAFDVAASVCAGGKSCSQGGLCAEKTAAEIQTGLCASLGNVRAAPTASLGQFSEAAGVGSATSSDMELAAATTVPPTEGAAVRVGARSGAVGIGLWALGLLLV